MKEKEYNKLLSLVESKYQEAVGIAEKRRKEGLDAISKVRDLFDFTKRKLPYGFLNKAVTRAIASIEGGFTKRTLLQEITKQIEPEKAKAINLTSLSGCLIRLEKQKILKVKKRGTGSILTVYESDIPKNTL